MRKVIACVTIDWEGENLNGLNDLRIMRKRLPVNLPVTHFICPNYFVNPSVSIRSRVSTAIHSIDEVGLHVHPYKSLVRGAGGIRFRGEPNFHSHFPHLEKLPGKLFALLRSRLASGRGVPLSAYSLSEIYSITEFSLSLLANAFKGRSICSFRAGGWIATDDVFRAIERLGFRFDSSAVPPDLLSKGYSKSSKGSQLDDYGDANGIFTELVCDLWGYHRSCSQVTHNAQIRGVLKDYAVTTHTQPFMLGGITEIPNNGGLTDFASTRGTLKPLLKHAIAEAHGGNDFYLTLGCHQEGDWRFKHELVRFIQSIPKDMLEMIEFMTISEAGERYINRLAEEKRESS